MSFFSYFDFCGGAQTQKNAREAMHEDNKATTTNSFKTMTREEPASSKVAPMDLLREAQPKPKPKAQPIVVVNTQPILPFIEANKFVWSIKNTTKTKERWETLLKNGPNAFDNDGFLVLFKDVDSEEDFLVRPFDTLEDKNELMDISLVAVLKTPVRSTIYALELVQCFYNNFSRKKSRIDFTSNVTILEGDWFQVDKETSLNKVKNTIEKMVKEINDHPRFRGLPWSAQVQKVLKQSSHSSILEKDK
jgi:hypothetical protein